MSQCQSFFISASENWLACRSCNRRASCGNRTEPCNHKRRNQKSPSFFKHSVKRICSGNPFWIPENPFSDWVIHHAIMNVLEPVFERQFIFHTYTCRKGKGAHAVFNQFLFRIIIFLFSFNSPLTFLWGGYNKRQIFFSGGGNEKNFQFIDNFFCYQQF